MGDLLYLPQENLESTVGAPAVAVDRLPNELPPRVQADSELLSGQTAYDPVAEYHQAKHGVRTALDDLSVWSLAKIALNRRKILQSLEDVTDSAMEQTREDFEVYMGEHRHDVTPETLLPTTFAFLLNNLRTQYEQSGLSAHLGDRLSEEFLRGARSVVYVVLHNPEAERHLSQGDFAAYLSSIETLFAPVESADNPFPMIDQLVDRYEAQPTLIEHRLAA